MKRHAEAGQARGLNLLALLYMRRDLHSLLLQELLSLPSQDGRHLGRRFLDVPFLGGVFKSVCRWIVEGVSQSARAATRTGCR